MPYAPTDTANYLIGWDGGDSNATVNANGSFSSFGTNLAPAYLGNSGTFSAVNTPRYNPFSKALLLPPLSDTGSTRAAMLCSLPATSNPGTRVWNQRRLMWGLVVKPQNMIGDGSSGAQAGTFCATNASSSQAATLINYVASGANQAAAGFKTFSGGPASANSSVRIGCDLQVLVYYANSSTGGFGFVNTIGSKTSAISTNSNTYDGWYLGHNVISGFNPYIGDILAAHLWALEDNSGSNYTDTDAGNVLTYLVNKFSVTTGRTKIFTVCGDSRANPYARIWSDSANSGSGALNTTLNGALSAPNTTTDVTVVASAGMTARLNIEPGKTNAEVLTVSSLPNGTTIRWTTNYVKTHANAGLVADANVGINAPDCSPYKMSRLLNDGTYSDGNYGTPGQKLSNAQTSPSTDGSMSILSSQYNTAIGIIQRVYNDIIIDNPARATLLGYAETHATNYRTAAAAVSIANVKVLVCQCLASFSFSGSNLTTQANYHTDIAANLNGKFDGVVRFYDHIWCRNPEDPRSITPAGCTLSTTVYGDMWDAPGTHEKRFVAGCEATMIDDAVSKFLGVSRGYSPSVPVVTLSKSGNSTVITYGTPTAIGTIPQVPQMTAGADGHLGTTVYVYRGNLLLARIPPTSIDANTCLADWTGRTSYTDTSPTGESYSVRFVDASGATQQTSAGSGGWLSRQFARARLQRGR